MSHAAILAGPGRAFARGDLTPTEPRERPLNSSIDLNSMLANVERTFALRARLCRAEAAEAEAQIGKPENVYTNGVYREKADQARAMADRWEARRREAAEGYFLARPTDLTDPDYIQEFGDVMAQAQEAGRVVYQETPENDRIHRAVGG